MRSLLFICLLSLTMSQTGNWGYGYADLLNDLDLWAASPWVTIDSIGASVQNRALWELTITDTAPGVKSTVYIHVRTHPNEVQSFWVTEAFIDLLLSDDPYAGDMRRTCTFYIIPMYNPDGVELGYPRQNAHQIDIESNWDDAVLEPEPAALQQRFSQLMSSTEPIRIALNMHAAYGGNPRYFVYHHENGTSAEYAALEQVFIAGVRSYFPTGIGPWDTFVSWTGGTPDQYPESWWWFNYGSEVMALTYEDWNNADAGQFDSTAYALLHGIGDYLDYTLDTTPLTGLPQGFRLYQNYPNPLNATTRIPFTILRTGVYTLDIYDARGRLVESLFQGRLSKGKQVITWISDAVPSGLYFYRLTGSSGSGTRKMTVLK
ncbi:MAG: M14 family zinc carboxypeptidase [Fidelibacterota bacterium]